MTKFENTDGALLTLGSLGVLTASMWLRDLGWIEPAGSGNTARPKKTCTLVPLHEDNPEMLEALVGDYYHFFDAVENLFYRSEIKLSREEEPFEACITPDGLLYGASAISLREDQASPEYRVVRFSIAVDESARRYGVGSKLVKGILRAFPPEKHIIEAWVVNPHMVTLLENLGFEADGEWSQYNPFMRYAG